MKQAAAKALPLVPLNTTLFGTVAGWEIIPVYSGTLYAILGVGEDDG